jgi:hypothetical protein
MKSLKSLALILVAMLISFSALAAELRLGAYTVKGANPGGQGAYDGKVTITQNGENYNMVWSLGPNGEQKQYGTGMVIGDILSVAYLDGSGQDFGVVTYKLDGNTLNGQWIPFGADVRGTETLTFSETLKK